MVEVRPVFPSAVGADAQGDTSDWQDEAIEGVADHIRDRLGLTERGA